MSQSLASRPVRTQQVSVRSGPDGLKGKTTTPAFVRSGPDGLKTDQDLQPREAFALLIEETLQRAGELPKDGYLAANVNKRIWHDAMNRDGRSNFAGHWLLTQSDAFVEAFIKILSARRGLDPQRVRDLRAQRIIELAALIAEDTRVER